MTPHSRLLFLGVFNSLPEVVDYSYFGISAGDGAKFAEEVILCRITVVELGLSPAKLRAGDVGSIQVGQTVYRQLFVPVRTLFGDIKI
jgi:hypothetical protein